MRHVEIRLMTALRLLAAIVLAVLLALPARVAEAQPPASTGDGAYRGYFAARLLDGGKLQVIDELNAGRLFVPASVLKVVTVAAALEHLGPEYRWVTRLTTNGHVERGILDGDLVVEPGADPTWGAFFDDGAAEPLAALAGQVRARGVTRIAGDLVVDAGRFPGRLYPLDRSFGNLPYRHGAPPSGLAVDEATITVRVAPGPAVGAPARVAGPRRRRRDQPDAHRGPPTATAPAAWTSCPYGTPTRCCSAASTRSASRPSRSRPATPHPCCAQHAACAMHCTTPASPSKGPCASRPERGPRRTRPPCSRNCTRPRWKSSSGRS